jgi:hypothetical protein
VQNDRRESIRQTEPRGHNSLACRSRDHSAIYHASEDRFFRACKS